MKKKGTLLILSLAVMLLLTGCRKNLEPSKGGTLLFETEKGNLSIDSFYTELKDTYGLDTMLKMADEIILNEIYKDKFKEEEREFINKQKEQLNNYYEAQFKNLYPSFEGFVQAKYNMNIKELDKFLALAFKKTKETENYAKTIITNSEIKNYYDKKIVGDIKASHILIKPKYASDATDKERKKAKDEALKKAKDIIKKLDKGSKFADLVNKYSDDTKEDGGSLGWFNKGKTDPAFEAEAFKLKVDEYSKEPVESKFGYHIILKTGEKEKQPLEKIKKDIVKKLAEEKMQTVDKIDLKALIETRKRYGFKINDKVLNSKYKTYVNNLNAK